MAVKRSVYRERRYRTPPRGTLAHALEELRQANRDLWTEMAHALGLVALARAVTRWQRDRARHQMWRGR